MDFSALKELGLSEGQISVYTAVMDLGLTGVGGIQEKTGVERRNIYDILDKLIEKGYVTYTDEASGKKYQCTHPKKIEEDIKRKTDSLNNLQEQLPQITDYFVSKKPEIGAEVHRGNDSVKALLEEALNYKATYWISGDSGVETNSTDDMRRWFKHWMNRRVEQKRMMYDLVDHGTFLEGLEPNNIKAHKKNYYKYCSLPKGLESPIVMLIFGNKVAQILWSKRSFAFVMENEDLAEFFMKYFHYFWKEPY